MMTRAPLPRLASRLVSSLVSTVISVALVGAMGIEGTAAADPGLAEDADRQEESAAARMLGREPEAPSPAEVPPALFRGVPSVEVQRAMRAFGPSFRGCYEREPEGARVPASLQLAMELDEEGRVRTASVPGSTGASPRLRRCVTEVARRVQFPRPAVPPSADSLPAGPAEAARPLVLSYSLYFEHLD